MADCFLRDDLRRQQPARMQDAEGLLAWAQGLANDAPAAAVYRDREGRRTVRVSVGGRGFFLKFHSGVGWRDILKNLLQARLPVTSARTEYRALAHLARIGVPAPRVAAFASRGVNPARRRSVLITDELAGTRSLESYCAHWAAEPPPFAVRVGLVRELARIARTLHAAGVNHRDFYLCHFHLDPASAGQRQPRLYLIDLHRAQLRRRTPRRWRVKDLAGLYFSALDCGLCERDLLRFLRHYTPGGLRAALERDNALWRQVRRRAWRMYGKNDRATQAAPPEI